MPTIAPFRPIRVEILYAESRRIYRLQQFQANRRRLIELASEMEAR